MRGYGNLIRSARQRRGYTPEQLGERLGRSASIVYRLESEEQEPDAERINQLVATLPISADELVSAMGIRLSGPRCSKLPTQLVERLLELDLDQLDALNRLLGMSPATGSASH